MAQTEQAALAHFTPTEWWEKTRVRIDRCQLGTAGNDQLEATAAELIAWLTELNTFGEFHEAHLGDEPSYYSGFIIYEWMMEAKGFSLLWRDVLFQLQLTAVLVKEGGAQISDLVSLGDRSKNKLSAVAEALFAKLQEARDRTRPSPEVMETWRRQVSPWPVYREQIHTLGSQTKELTRNFKAVQRLSLSLADIKGFFVGNLERCADYLGRVEKTVTELHQKWSTDSSAVNLAEAIRTLEELQAAEPAFLTASDFGDRLDGMISRLPGDKTFIIGTDLGLLVKDEFSVSGRVGNWIQSELMSGVYDYYRDRQGLRGQLQMTILGLKNRLEFDRREEKKSDAEEILPLLVQLTEKISATGKRIGSAVVGMTERLENELNASGLFTPPFLPTIINPTINRYRRYRELGLRAVGDWIGRKTRALNNFRTDTRREENLSVSERIVRLVRARTPDERNTHYTNLFLTAGYIGESFRVGRTEQMDRVSRLVDNWRLGYRGAVLISGERFSGKTFLGEMIGYRFFPGRSIGLSPGKTIEINGRKHTLEEDLGASLAFVTKYAGDVEPTMVWIDDLHLWQSEKHNLAANVRSLLRTIDYHSGRLFFVVGADLGLLSQLRLFLDIDRYFQADIQATPMRQEEIKEAILIRHGATQMQIVDAEGEELEENELNRLLRKIYRRSQGNIGESLHRWAYTLRRKDEQRVTPNPDRFYTLPDHLSEDAGLLLRAIYVDRQSQEYLLRRQFGMAFRPVFQPILQRLLHLGVINRHLDGQLEVNPFLARDIARLLQRKNLLNPDPIKEKLEL